jgi:hypothetical protein
MVIKRTGTIVAHINVTSILIPHANVSLLHSRNIPDSLAPDWDFPWTCSVPSTQCCNTTLKMTTSSSKITIRCQRLMQIKNNCLMTCGRTATTTSLRPKPFQSPSLTLKRLEPQYTGLFTSAQLEPLLTSIKEVSSSNIVQNAHSAYRCFSSFCAVRLKLGHDHFFPHSLQFTIIQSIRRCIMWVTDSVVK